MVDWTGVCMRGRATLLAGTVAVLGMGLLAAEEAAAENITLRYNQWFPSGHWSQAEGLYPWFEEIARVTEGRVTVEPSAKPLAPPNRNYQAVVDGVADIAWGPHGYTPGVFPLTEMVEFPFITEDAGLSSRAYWRLWKAHFEPTGMQNDVVTLGMHVTAGGNISMREAQVTRLADLKGRKLRVPTPVVGRVLGKIGAVPVSGSLGELREMLSRGIIDGTVISDELVTGFHVDDDVHAVTRIPGGIFSSSAFIIVNKAKWERISEKDREAIRALSGERLSEIMGRLWHENDLKARAAFQERLGTAYQTASDAFQDELRAAYSEELAAWKARAREAGIDPEAAQAFYRQQIAEAGE